MALKRTNKILKRVELAMMVIAFRRKVMLCLDDLRASWIWLILGCSDRRRIWRVMNPLPSTALFSLEFDFSGCMSASTHLTAGGSNVVSWDRVDITTIFTSLRLFKCTFYATGTAVTPVMCSWLHLALRKHFFKVVFIQAEFTLDMRNVNTFTKSNTLRNAIVKKTVVGPNETHNSPSDLVESSKGLVYSSNYRFYSIKNSILTNICTTLQWLIQPSRGLKPSNLKWVEISPSVEISIGNW